MYFYYGIKHSSLEENNPDTTDIEGNAGNIELKITEHSTTAQAQEYVGQDRNIYEGQQLDAFGQPVFGSTNFGGSPSYATANTTQQQQQQSEGLFISQETFPTWDDWGGK